MTWSFATMTAHCKISHTAATLGVWCVHWLRLLVGFGIYALGSIILLVTMPFLFLGCGFSFRRFGALTRFFVHHFFACVIWYVRLMRIVDVKIIRHSEDELQSILVCNHISLFDIISVLASFPGCITLVSAKYWQIPIVRPIAWSCGFIPVNANDTQSRMQAFLRARAVLDQGHRLVVFPEGTRTNSGELGPFQTGVFKLALEGGFDLTPLVFSSSRPAFSNVPKKKHDLSMVSYCVHVMPRVPTPKLGATRVEAKRFRDSVRAHFVRWQGAAWIYNWQRERSEIS